MPTYRVEGYSLYKQAKGWFEIITNGDFAREPGEAEQKLKNAHSLKELLSNMTVPEDHELVSFDVKSLFTSIPLDLARESV